MVIEILSSKRIRSTKPMEGWIIWVDLPEDNLFYDGFRSVADAINFIVDFIEKRSKIWPNGEGKYIVQTY